MALIQRQVSTTWIFESEVSLPVIDRGSAVFEHFSGLACFSRKVYVGKLRPWKWMAATLNIIPIKQQIDHQRPPFWGVQKPLIFRVKIYCEAPESPSLFVSLEELYAVLYAHPLCSSFDSPSTLVRRVRHFWRWDAMMNWTITGDWVFE